MGLRVKALTLLALWVPDSVSSSSTETNGSLGFLTRKTAVITAASKVAEVEKCGQLYRITLHTPGCL